MRTSSFDPIALLEDAYRPHEDARAWLRAIAPTIIAPFDEDGYGAVSYFVDTSQGYAPTDVAYYPGPHALDQSALLRALRAGVAAMSVAQLDTAYRVMQCPGAYSFLDTFGDFSREARAQLAGPIGDSPAVIIPTGEAVVAIVAGYTLRRRTVAADERALWARIAIHLGTAYRLSGRLASAEAPDVEAVLGPGGQLVDARGVAVVPRNCELLRRGACDRERARARAERSDPVRALGLWQALIGGRWSLVDYVDTDGRCFLLARHNEPGRRGQTRLTHRQRQVLFYSSVGWSLKQTAYALGLSSVGTVSRHLSSGLRRMGIASRTDLIRITTQWTKTKNDRAVSRMPHSVLTEAEREVAAHVLDGLTNMQIAERRGVSVRTIANQLGSTYRKLALQGRHDLAHWLCSHEWTSSC